MGLGGMGLNAYEKPGCGVETASKLKKCLHIISKRRFYENKKH
jgi:hypothetical protein